MKNTKIKLEIKSWLGKVLFEYECENNTIKETLRNAVLSGADLSGAVLRNADLSGAALSGADLRNADLSDAVLRNAVLPIFCKWNVSIVDDKIKIGCKLKSISEWNAWFASDSEFSTQRKNESFKLIHANYLAAKAYYEFLNK